MKKHKDLIETIVIIVVIILIRTFVATPVMVDGDSMNPTLTNNQILILSKMSKKYERFDIVVALHKVEGKKERLVKRIIGLPGEYIEYIDGVLYVNKEEVKETFTDIETADFALAKLGFLKIPEGYYFIVGDNRINSTDSRILGLIPESEIKGKIVFSLFPFKTFGFVS